MALPNVLSAMREIILDAPQIPVDPLERAKVYRERFPKLSESEHEDLVKISPEKFSIYTVSIFQSEKGILENHLPLTFSLLKRHWTEAYNERFVGHRITHRLHQMRPWESQSPQVFVENFCQFINHDCQELLKIRPDLGAAARLEATNYQLKRAPDQPVEDSENCLNISALRALTVAELMNVTIEAAQPMRFLTLPFDVLALREQFFAAEREAPVECALRSTTFLAGARDQQNNLHWLSVTENVQNFLTDNLGGRATFESFAEKSLQDSPSPGDERSALEFILGQVVRLMSENLIVLRPPSA